MGLRARTSCNSLRSTNSLLPHPCLHSCSAAVALVVVASGAAEHCLCFAFFVLLGVA